MRKTISCFFFNSKIDKKCSFANWKMYNFKYPAHAPKFENLYIYSNSDEIGYLVTSDQTKGKTV